MIPICRHTSTTAVPSRPAATQRDLLFVNLDFFIASPYSLSKELQKRLTLVLICADIPGDVNPL